VETTSPVVVRRKELRPDSGGPGRYRGGLGQTIELEVRTGEPYAVSVLSDRMRFPAEGYLGAGAGAKAAFTTSDGVRRDPKMTQLLEPDTRFVLELPGGGGFHDPRDRDPAALAQDVAEGLVTEAAANRYYRTDAGAAADPGRPAS
jgi:N-methylhydantoinase B